MDGAPSLSVGRPDRHGELREILRLSLPLGAAYLTQMLMAATDTIMMGRLSAGALAAGGLGSNVAFMMIIVAQGLAASIQPIVAQARGAGDRSGFGRTLAAGLIAMAVSAVPIILVLVHVDRLLLAAGEPREIATMTLAYELAFVWGVPAGLWQMALRNYLSALERPHIIMVVVMLACGINFLLNWVLIFGHLGLPALGIAGSGYATATTWNLMALAFTFYIWRAGLVPAGFFGMALKEIGRGLAGLLRLGWPVSAIYLVEVGLFSVSSLLMGRFGPVALAAHQICLGIASFTFMVPLSIGQAATVRIGFHIGAGQIVRARRTGFTALALGIVFMSLMSGVILLFGRSIFRLYLDPADSEFDAVLDVGTQLLAIAALFQVFDGAQVVAACALRGLKDMRASLIAASIGYWGLGLPIGVGLAFGLGMGPPGLWWGFVAGLVVVSILLSLRFHRRTAAIIAAAGVAPA
ncbi:MAG TPA: MATE family efflux transporter [Aliidongia sp.]|nr:MATE family efflux transporter [Aliidongia sp.]